eukprot:scaffold153799_cov29-Tisochrysis_lutea.AAC.13
MSRRVPSLHSHCPCVPCEHPSLALCLTCACAYNRRGSTATPPPLPTFSTTSRASYVQIPHLLSAKEEAAAAKANQKSKVASASPPVANASAAVPSAALSTEADVPQIPNVPQTGAPSSSTSGTSALPFAQPDAAGAHGGSSRGTMKLSAASRLDPFGSETKAPADATREFKQLLKTMILGVKTVVWSVSNSQSSHKAQRVCFVTLRLAHPLRALTVAFTASPDGRLADAEGHVGGRMPPRGAAS